MWRRVLGITSWRVVPAAQHYFVEGCNTRLDAATHIGTSCVKGRKTGGLATPNQDNFFCVQVELRQLFSVSKHEASDTSINKPSDSKSSNMKALSVSIQGVLDGHGPFGHLVSFRLSQTLPYYILNSEYFNAHSMGDVFKDAFWAANADLIKFGEKNNVNFPKHKRTAPSGPPWTPTGLL